MKPRTASVQAPPRVMCLLAAFVGVAAVLSAQPATRTAGSISRADTGRPNLEGVWTYGTTTPLERPARFADRRVIADAEIQAYVRYAAAERRAQVAARLGIDDDK